MELVEWERVVSAQVVASPVPFVATVIGWDGQAGAFFERIDPVLALLVEVIESYSRPRYDDYDSGRPRQPPSPKHLAEEGYRFQDRRTRIRHLVEDWERNTLDPVNEDGENGENVAILVHPAGEKPSPYGRWVAYKLLAAKYGATVPPDVTKPAD